jgi:hypothetical protein
MRGVLRQGLHTTRLNHGGFGEDLRHQLCGAPAAHAKITSLPVTSIANSKFSTRQVHPCLQRHNFLFFSQASPSPAQPLRSKCLQFKIPKMTKDHNDPRQTPISHLRCHLQVFHPPSSPLPPLSQLFVFLASLTLTRAAASVKLSAIQNLKMTKEHDDPPQTPNHLCCQLRVFYPPCSPLPPSSQIVVFSQASARPPAQPLLLKCQKFKIQK